MEATEQAVNNPMDIANAPTEKTDIQKKFEGVLGLLDRATSLSCYHVLSARYYNTLLLMAKTCLESYAKSVDGADAQRVVQFIEESNAKLLTEIKEGSFEHMMKLTGATDKEFPPSFREMVGARFKAGV